MSHLYAGRAECKSFKPPFVLMRYGEKRKCDVGAVHVEHARMHPTSREFDNNATFTGGKWRVDCHTKEFLQVAVSDERKRGPYFQPPLKAFM